MLKSAPLVSIIIPTYNRAHLISETLDSVLAQTYTNWECIVVDDGSTDETESLLATYCKTDARFQYHHRPENSLPGGNAARNFGYELSKGVYVQWFDSDDVMHPDKLKIKLGYAIAHKVDIIVDTHTTIRNIEVENHFKVELFVSSEFYVEYILGKRPVITNDVMVKRVIINERRFDEVLRKAQEYEFFSRLFEQNLKYCFLDVPLTFYRKSQESISKGASIGNNKQIESLIYLSKKMQKTHSLNPLIIAKAERQGQKTYKWLMINNGLKLVLSNFMFFKEAYNMSMMKFVLYFIYNTITKRGFDKMKLNNSN